MEHIITLIAFCHIVEELNVTISMNACDLYDRTFWRLETNYVLPRQTDKVEQVYKKSTGLQVLWGPNNTWVEIHKNSAQCLSLFDGTLPAHQVRHFSV
jgi:hypothetical protein